MCTRNSGKGGVSSERRENGGNRQRRRETWGLGEGFPLRHLSCRPRRAQVSLSWPLAAARRLLWSLATGGGRPCNSPGGRELVARRNSGLKLAYFIIGDEYGGSRRDGKVIRERRWRRRWGKRRGKEKEKRWTKGSWIEKISLDKRKRRKAGRARSEKRRRRGKFFEPRPVSVAECHRQGAAEVPPRKSLPHSPLSALRLRCGFP